ncbi:MAG: ATP-binding protein [Oscillospiraceae bacterium]|nr:ATP-binding protein [Oscillospiraceae bacterium]
MSFGTITFIIGKLCVGKSTLANKLTQKEPAVILSCDELMTAIHPVDLGFDYESELSKVKHYLWLLSVSVTSTGTDVILDWGFWAKSERDLLYRDLIKRNIPQKWVYLSPAKEEWQKRIAERNQSIETNGGKDYFISDALLAKCQKRFQAPSIKEIRQKRIKIYA